MKALSSCVATLLLAGVAGAQAVDPNNPGSLWPTHYINPMMDRTARAEGDVVTILISESTIASFAASTKASKSDDNAITRAVGPLIDKLIPALSTAASSTVDGKGNTSQSGRLVARMTGIVKQVLPNGQLVLEGTRSVQVNKQVQTFRLTGVVRRDDIRSDNTVLSEHIAEASITVDGKGMISDRQQRGILTRILDWLF
ncbi:MAG: flagellar basal body L-ring protein FlgH [Armatimonadetes bacterium]|nr:MAG: flagellar basal body L-ring protein FlgH [Armatimonadota bacterium]